MKIRRCVIHSLFLGHLVLPFLAARGPEKAARCTDDRFPVASLKRQDAKTHVLNASQTDLGRWLITVSPGGRWLSQPGCYQGQRC